MRRFRKNKEQKRALLKGALLLFCLCAVAAGKMKTMPQESNVCREEQMLPPKEGTTFAPYVLTSTMCSPIAGMVTSEFVWREHPISHEQDFHKGVDIAAVEGTAVHAALPGKVEQTGYDSARGNFVVLRHSDDLFTSYLHCKEILVQEGTNLSKGDRIALVGSTGISTGPHLHFEVEVEGKKADPMFALPVRES